MLRADEIQPASQSQALHEAVTPSSSGRKSAQQIATEHQQELTVIHALLKKQGLVSLPQRLSSGDAELIRYCHTAIAVMQSCLCALQTCHCLLQVSAYKVHIQQALLVSCRYAIAAGAFRADSEPERCVLLPYMHTPLLCPSPTFTEASAIAVFVCISNTWLQWLFVKRQVTSTGKSSCGSTSYSQLAEGTPISFQRGNATIQDSCECTVRSTLH